MISYLHNDHLGSVILTTNDQGLAVSHREYMPFGGPGSELGHVPFQSAFRYTGKELDQESGLYSLEGGSTTH